MALERQTMQNNETAPPVTQVDYEEMLGRITAERIFAPPADYFKELGLPYAAQIVEGYVDGVKSFRDETGVESFAGLPAIIAKADLNVHPYTQERLLHDLGLLREKYGIFLVCTEVGGGPKFVGKLPPAEPGMTDDQVIANTKALLQEMKEMGYKVALGYNDFSFALSYKSPRVGSNHVKEDGTVGESTIRDSYDHGLFAAARQYQAGRTAYENGEIRIARVAHTDETESIHFIVKGVGLIEEDETKLVKALRTCSPEEYRSKLERYNYNLQLGNIESLPIGGWRRQIIDVVGSGKVIKQIHDAYSVVDNKDAPGFLATVKPVDKRTIGLEKWINFLVNSAGFLSQAHVLHQQILEEALDEISEYVPAEIQHLVRNGYGLRSGEWLDIVYPDIWRYVAEAEGGHYAQLLFKKYNRKVSEMVIMMNMIFTMNNEGSYAASNFPIMDYKPGEQWKNLRVEGTFYNWTTQGIFLDGGIHGMATAMEGAAAVISTANNGAFHTADGKARREALAGSVNVTELTETHNLFTMPTVTVDHIMHPNYV